MAVPSSVVQPGPMPASNDARVPSRQVRDGVAQPSPAPTSARPGLVVTSAEYAACRAELERLREIRDHDLPDLLRFARTFVASDAAEEIAEIRKDQAYLEDRITRLERLFGDAEVVDERQPHGR